MLKVRDITQAKKAMMEKLESLHVSYTLCAKPFAVYMNLGIEHYNRIYIWWNDTKDSTHTMHEDIQLEINEVPAELIM